ncbi:secreted protein containing Sulfatase domain protein [Rhodopirellula maiorica SM1]|uniref:Secreted protein containing Sulfatase domain protein n=1 Tax=Rhodopirellula maiorica SM1 TaxID=1265738 RepID=M5S167_9BACT|nr:sulfatase-like hydrolase/transferase [Rhodopirellula maiorica]EMI19919.1 secreted protein containing Sulfatase domain protein [Rhodopirellula maiorica SM1]
MRRLNYPRFAVLASLLLAVTATIAQAETPKPNIVFILTDDHRWDGTGESGGEFVRTPNLDRITASGTRFENAFVTLAICSPSRAACLTGRYGSANGVTEIGKSHIHASEVTFAQSLRKIGYQTGVTGKWHLGNEPDTCGFDFVSTCWSNGTWYDRKFTIAGETKVMPGFVDDVTADESIRFIREASQHEEPFVLWMNTQVPHMDHRHQWPAKQAFLDQYEASEMPLPETWNDDLSGKPEYLKTARNRTQALAYGYDDPANIRQHAKEYFASVQQMDAAVRRVLDEIDSLEIRDNTWIIVMGDNGWMLGEHGMTSKVLPYEESMRVPMTIAGPGTETQVVSELVLNIDVTATIYDLAGLPVPESLHGRSLLPLVHAETPDDWRSSFLYEAPSSQLGSQPLWAVRNARWKYVETETNEGERFAELYDLVQDRMEQTNLANEPSNANVVNELANQLREYQREIGSHTVTLVSEDRPERETQDERQAGSLSHSDEKVRNDIHISGIYPHLTAYGVYSQNGGHFKSGHDECGIGAIVPWAGKLWMVNYAPHQPNGSEHKLFSIGEDLQSLTVHPESVGGTPAGRMIHAESNQLLIAHYLIDAEGNVRVISPADMPMRVTAITRHLTDPANMVYYIDMEGAIWEANVHTLAVKRLFKKPVPGWHGKGAYVSQGRLVVSNNGEHAAGTYDDLVVGGAAKNSEERGVLAEYDGENWKIIERRQYTEVTGPNGIAGGSDGNDPIWTMGWDRRSVRLKVLDDGTWHTYLLPKAAFCNDAIHGWYTEWPRIREITDGRWMMDMHGMFFDFPKTFSSQNSAGIKPIGSHLRYIPDFCAWNDQLVLASDETSIQGNPLAGQPQTNLWFGSYDDLKDWGPASGYGGPWIEDEVMANTPSDPFLVAGFDRRVLHLASGRTKPADGQKALRASDQLEIQSMPDRLATLPRVTVPRGNWHREAKGYSFDVDQPVTVFLAVDRRGNPKLDPAWKITDMSLIWGKNLQDVVYVRSFEPGTITIPENATEHRPGSFGMPHTAFVLGSKPSELQIKTDRTSIVTQPNASIRTEESSIPVVFDLQVDRHGDGNWVDYQSIEVPAAGYVAYQLPDDFDAVWLRLKTNRDCVATAYLHQTTAAFVDGDESENQTLFAGLAGVDDDQARGALVYAAKRNRNLRVIASEDRFFDFTKTGFEFKADTVDPLLADKLSVKPHFTVDDASVILKHGGKRLRLPKGDAAYDKPFASGWPRDVREVESERVLANIHGTFYEVPLVINGAPPAFNLMRPVSSHAKQIADFCTWNGLLVLTGVRADAENDGHVFADAKQNTALWFGGVDDLWKFGKPVGHGGPWLNTMVKAGQPSDPYLMKGYDRKSLSLSHDANEAVTMHVEVDITGDGHWRRYKSFDVAAGETLEYSFPDAFSAAWVRLVSASDTIATAQLQYE